MEEKQRRHWPNPSLMSSNEGTSFGAGLSAPASDSASTRTIVHEETVTRLTPEECRAIERVRFSIFFLRVAPPSDIPLQKT
jgi:hypothetical protein